MSPVEAKFLSPILQNQMLRKRHFSIQSRNKSLTVQHTNIAVHKKQSQAGLNQTEMRGYIAQIPPRPVL